MRISRRYLFVAVPMSYIMSDYPPTNATPHAGSIPRLLIGFDRRKSPIRRSSCVLVSYPHLCNLIPCPHLLALFEHPICSQHQLKTEEAPLPISRRNSRYSLTASFFSYSKFMISLVFARDASEMRGLWTWGGHQSYTLIHILLYRVEQKAGENISRGPLFDTHALAWTRGE